MGGLRSHWLAGWWRASNIIFILDPREMIQFDEHIILKGVETTNQLVDFVFQILNG